jgi:hypothetical protein
MKTYWHSLSILFVFLCVLCASQAQASSTGFIPGQIWYSKDTLVAGDTVKIYTVVWNANPEPINVRVEFYDKTTVLGTRDIVLEKEQLKDVSVSWNVTAGDHVISAKITSSTITTAGKKESVILDNRTTAEDVKFVPAGGSASVSETAPSLDMASSQFFHNVETALNGAIPSSVRLPVSRFFSRVEAFRLDTYASVQKKIKETEKKIDVLSEKKNPSGTDKPIAQITLILLMVCRFCLSTQFVFYIVSALFIFIVLRFLYRMIRNKEE